MKNKASLVLLEQLVMILVFSLAAVLCLRSFAWSDQTSREMKLRDRAVISCQNGAETLKAAGSPEAAAQILGAAKQGAKWIVASDGDFLLELEEMEAPVSGMGAAEIRAVSEATEEILFSITVGWQEVAP